VKSRARLLALLGALTTSSARLFAQSRAAETARAMETARAIQLFDEAEKLMASGQAAAACSKFAESHRRDPQLGTLLHLADCHEKIGKTASAYAGYKEAAEIAARRNATGGNERREQVARARAAALEPRVSNVVLRIAREDIAGLEVRRDGEPLARGAWGSAIPVDPGKYTFIARAPGKKPWTQTIEVPADGAKVELAIPPLADDAAPSPTADLSHATSLDRATSTADPSASGATQRTAGYLLAGAGVVAAGVGVAFGLRGRSQIEERDDILCPANVCTAEQGQRIERLQADASTSATVFNVAFPMGAAALLGGVALVLTAPSRPIRSAALLHVVPWAGMNWAGASVSGHW
jgi:hypothetical protein